MPGVFTHRFVCLCVCAKLYSLFSAGVIHEVIYMLFVCFCFVFCITTTIKKMSKSTVGTCVLRFICVFVLY